MQQLADNGVLLPVGGPVLSLHTLTGGSASSHTPRHCREAAAHTQRQTRSGFRLLMPMQMKVFYFYTVYIEK